MNKPRKPWLCNSLSRCKPPQTYCIECNHATFRGQATIDGKLYRWFWGPYGGVELELRGTGNWHISRTHPVWTAIAKWIDRLLRQSETKDGKQ